MAVGKLIHSLSKPFAIYEEVSENLSEEIDVYESFCGNFPIWSQDNSGQ